MPKITTRVPGSASPTPSTPVGDDAKLNLQQPAPVTKPEAQDAAKKAAHKLLATVEAAKGLDGKLALEGFGKGDPRVTERRSALATLLQDQSGSVEEAALKAISAEIATDVEWLKTAEMREYSPTGSNEFAWYTPFDNHTVDHEKLNAELSKRVKEQTATAKAFVDGTKKYMDVSTMSVYGLATIDDGTKRAHGLMDALLQFRARTDSANQREDGWTTRIDRFGLAILAEQRILLAGAELVEGNAFSERDWALLREVISSHPISSTNGIFDARNAVSSILIDQGKYQEREKSYGSPTAWIRSDKPPGATASAYSAIHHNFSRDTPKNVRLVLEEWMMPLGQREQRAPLFVALVDAMTRARAGNLDGAKSALAGAARFGKAGGVALPDFVVQNGAGLDAAKLADSLKTFLESTCTKKLGANVEKNLEMTARLYTSVVSAQPTVDTLEKNLFKAGPAWKELADVVVALKKGDDALSLMELGQARLALQGAVFATKSGFERKELITLDAHLARMTNELLGAIVDKVGTLKGDGDKSLALLAMQAALRSAVASGLHAVVDETDPAAASPELLKRALADVDAALAKGSIQESEYRRLMGQAHVAVTKTVQNIRSFADMRAGDVAGAGVQLDPEFIDQFIKGTPLHYATALAQKGMAVGLRETISARKIENVEGMRVLNGIGPVVFQSVVFAENSKQLAEMGTNKDQLAILYKLEEKKMVAVGGLFVDTEHAPGGNSHLNMYAMNNGIPVVALPELRTKYAEFFATAQAEGGVYVDDSADGGGGDGFTMMTVKAAQEEGRIGAEPDAIDKLRPGVNRNITYLKPSTISAGFEQVAKHDAIINDKRPTRTVELYIPQETVRGVGKGVPTFKELAQLGVYARHLAGEKGTVLALLSQHPILGKHVPDGSVISPGDIEDLLKGAAMPGGKTLNDHWDAVWNADPKVGVVDDRNFRQSAFYTDARYRRRTREDLVENTRKALTKSLLDNSTNPPTLTEDGEKLYKNIMRNAALAEAETGSIIFRSSFTGEDRPGKSGAGQYESYVDRKCANKLYGKDVVDAQFDKLMAAKATKDPAKIKAALEEHNRFMGPARVDAAIGVIESAWMPEPIENNVAEQFFLKHIGPTCVVQACMTPDISGVMISRDVENGARNVVTFQLVRGFGGGVDGGKATEGTVGRDISVHFVDGEEKAGAPVTVKDVSVTDDDMKKLRDVVLETERYFNEVVEPGKGFAVDMEVARQDGEWKVVQARVILVDK